MTDKKSFGSFIKIKRTEKNYSQKDLAELLFVTEGRTVVCYRGRCKQMGARCVLSRHHFDF